MKLFQVERPQFRTMVVFAAPDGLFEVYRLRVDLPEEIRWRELYVAPLVLAFDEYTSRTGSRSWTRRSSAFW